MCEDANLARFGDSVNVVVATLSNRGVLSKVASTVETAITARLGGLTVVMIDDTRHAEPIAAQDLTHAQTVS